MCDVQVPQKYNIQVSLQVVMAMDLYLASADDLDTALCFLDLQDTKALPKNKHKPVREFLVSGHPAQCASQ